MRTLDTLGGIFHYYIYSPSVLWLEIPHPVYSFRNGINRGKGNLIV